jgi:hypothetical protein
MTKPTKVIVSGDKYQRLYCVTQNSSHEADTCETLGPVTYVTPAPKPTLWQRIYRFFTGYPIDREE